MDRWWYCLVKGACKACALWASAVHYGNLRPGRRAYFGCLLGRAPDCNRRRRWRRRPIDAHNPNPPPDAAYARTPYPTL